MNVPGYKRKIRAEVLMFHRWLALAEVGDTDPVWRELRGALAQVKKEAAAIGLEVLESEFRRAEKLPPMTWGQLKELETK